MPKAPAAAATKYRATRIPAALSRPVRSTAATLPTTSITGNATWISPWAAASRIVLRRTARALSTVATRDLRRIGRYRRGWGRG
ncbi:MAG: hypothetical protein HYU54_01505 [Actinobacteria bacterium]|nr:hypothetical protein [Actinomycetota bacterium]